MSDITCKYHDTYLDMDTTASLEYDCEMLSLPSGLCIFHDPEFLTPETENKVLDEFFHLIKIAIDEKRPLNCNGFHLPLFELKYCVFSAPVYFVNVKFTQEVTFFANEFTSISFSHSEFYRSNRWQNVVISKKLIFSDIQFNDRTNTFQNVTVLQNSNFARTNFNKSRFYMCVFNSSLFRYTIFKKRTIFEKCIFSGRTDFAASTFLGKSIFSDSIFEHNCDFQQTQFNNDYNVKFLNVDFKEPKLVIFEGNLSNVSFKNTDITRIRFDKKIKWGESDRYSIFDERLLISNPKNVSLSSVLTIYRNLRESYEFHLMYEEAGRCFIKEMDLKRIYYEDQNDNYKTKIKKLQRYVSLTNCYNISCQYGESFKRVSIWILVLFFGTTIYFFLYPDIIDLEKTKPIGDIDYASKIAKDLVFKITITLYSTLYSFFQVNNNNLVENIMRTGGLAVLGIFFLVIRRRFERRFRH